MSSLLNDMLIAVLLADEERCAKLMDELLPGD